MGPFDEDTKLYSGMVYWPDNWKDSFYCLDHNTVYIVKPASKQNLSIALVPCQKVQIYGFEVPEECNDDYEKQKEYLYTKSTGIYQPNLFYSYQVFEPENYDHPRQ